jgi:hypothetical protein
MEEASWTPTHPPDLELAASGPEAGCVVVENVPLSQAEAWLEDGVYVIRSTEFDLLAEDEDFYEALGLFIDRAADYATALSELISSHEATEDEECLAGLLLRRLIAAFMAAEERRRAQRPRGPYEAAPRSTPSRLGRHPVRQMRELAHA